MPFVQALEVFTENSELRSQSRCWREEKGPVLAGLSLEADDKICATWRINEC